MQILPVIISNYNIGTESVIMYKYYDPNTNIYTIASNDSIYMFVRVILLVLVTPSGLVILIVIYNALTNILFNRLCPCFRESTSRKSF